MKVGKRAAAEASFWKDGVELTTGTAQARWWRWNGATREYLQADLSWAASPHDHAAAYSEGAWVHGFALPASASGYELGWSVTHSDAELPPVTGSVDVTTVDEDDVHDVASAIRATDVPALNANIDATQAELGTSLDPSSSETVQGRLRKVRDELDEADQVTYERVSG